MIMPFIMSVSREVLLAVPNSQREAAMALGATRWEAVRTAIVPYARSGIIGAIILGLGRALGETMAVTMLIGNRHDISTSLFAPGYTMAAVIANEFAEAATPMHYRRADVRRAAALRRHGAGQRRRAAADLAGRRGAGPGGPDDEPPRVPALQEQRDGGADDRGRDRRRAAAALHPRLAGRSAAPARSRSRSSPGCRCRPARLAAACCTRSSAR